jgi:hypothetical protein
MLHDAIVGHSHVKVIYFLAFVVVVAESFGFHGLKEEAAIGYSRKGRVVALAVGEHL